MIYKFIIGFGAGVWVGTYYDCKPILHKIKDELTKIIPKEKDP